MFQGRLTKEEVPQASKELAKLEKESGPITLDLNAVTELDSSGVAMLSIFFKKMRIQGRQVRLTNLSPPVQQKLKLFPQTTEEETQASERKSSLEALGERSQGVLELLFEFLLLASDTAWFLIGGILRPATLRWDAVVYEMSAMGSKAMGVVGLISFLVGGTMALQSATQLRQFGANIFVVDLIGISMTRELGPLMAAIVVAGRSGSAVAAELGTMVITEEIDALKTMGLHPTRFLVVPKVLAITITQPLVTMLANVFGIMGGFLVAVTYLEVGPTTFFSRLQESLMVKDLLTGLFKSVLFAQLIVLVGAINGLRTKGGADAVGRSTTTSVVAGIFAVICADAVTSLLFYFGN